MHPAIPIITGLVGLYTLIRGTIGIYRVPQMARDQREMAQMALKHTGLPAIAEVGPNLDKIVVRIGGDIDDALESMRRTDDWCDARRSYPEFYIFPGLLTAVGIILISIAWWMW